MYNFKSDYLEGAHESIMKALVSTNFEQSVGYSMDDYSTSAHNLIKEHIKCENVDVHLLVGGTQTNLLAISSFLRVHQSVIAVETAHINVHETGAIEATGHKICLCQGVEGKITPAEIENIVSFHTDEHMVQPKMVFISNATEVGTTYTKSELIAIFEVCQRHHLYLYLDGARMGNALVSEGNDLLLEDYPKYCDAFYIGGTKNGALFGEALVIVNDELKNDFRYAIKQKGAMFAKGRLLGIQFIELFKDHLYYDLARNANDTCALLKSGLEKMHFEFTSNANTNQLFVIFNNDLLEKMKNNYEYTFMKALNNQESEIRLVTSWYTPIEIVEEFLIFISKNRKGECDGRI